MQIGDIRNKEEFYAIVINELREEHGVKYKKEKKKATQDKLGRKQIFRTYLHSLELTDVILSNGSVVQIPKFVADACNCILENVEVEGIFRKAGSSLRQKEIRLSLEAGLPLGKSHHVIDVANVVKYFFRELPEPVIQPYLQETLLRCFLIGENHIKAILLACLLLPPLQLNTLSFFMQFLYTVSLSLGKNKMSIENLAIIFTPSLMPFPNVASHRFKNHLKIVQLLIENANLIGTIPKNIVEKMQLHLTSRMPSKRLEALEVLQKKKKKRRSEMFNGLRKIVGSAIGSSENLQNTHDNMTASTETLAMNQVQQQQQWVVTPCLKQSKKRKITDPVCAFSAKKKRDLLALLPNNSGGFLPNTPMTKESKKSRLSLGGSRHIRDTAYHPAVAAVERRWSVVGTGWPKHKNKTTIETESESLSGNYALAVKSTKFNTYVEPISEPSLKDGESINEETYISTDEFNAVNSAENGVMVNSEYEAIKARVSAIETHISREFETLTQSCIDHSTVLTESPTEAFSGPGNVQQKYEQIVAETGELRSPTTELLAKRLSRELKIRRSLERRVVRSPSARKISTIRRRSQEKINISRNPTWHVSSTCSSKKVFSCSKETALVASGALTHSKEDLKRTCPCAFPETVIEQDTLGSQLTIPSDLGNEEWTAGEMFFKTHAVSLKKSIEPTKEKISKTPLVKQYSAESTNTPMLPPLSAPRKANSVRTPISSVKASITSTIALGNHFVMSTPVGEESNGRASIARLLTQNAGMVMAKAKLFDGLGKSCIDIEDGYSALNECHSKQTKSYLSVAPITRLNNTSQKSLCQIVGSETPTSSHRSNESTVSDSPSFSKKKHRLPSSLKCSQLLQNDDITVTTRKNLTVCHNNKKDKSVIASPRVTKPRKYLNVNSPRRVYSSQLEREGLHDRNRNSPSRMKSRSVRNK